MLFVLDILYTSAYTCYTYCTMRLLVDAARQVDARATRFACNTARSQTCNLFQFIVIQHNMQYLISDNSCKISFARKKIQISIHENEIATHD